MTILIALPNILFIFSDRAKEKMIKTSSGENYLNCFIKIDEECYDDFTRNASEGAKITLNAYHEKENLSRRIFGLEPEVGVCLYDDDICWLGE